MDEAAKLELLKLELQRTGTVLEPLLSHYLAAAAERIGQMGITLGASAGDAALQISYAAHLYRVRVDPETEMPRSLRWELCNRLFSEKGRVDE